MANEKESFVLDLDAKGFIKGANEAQLALKELGEVESLKNLTSYLTQATLILGGVATAVLAVKSALDLTVEAESIKRINNQFEMLAGNAGIAADTLKTGLEEAAGGLIDTDELLQSANKAIVAMGDKAARLPEILEAAKNSTLIFGGTITSNFEALNQAIASGQTRSLRSLGLIIDSEDAYRKYANSIGVAVSALDDQERKTAILNAVLEKSRETFKNNKTDITDATFTVQKLKVSLKELADTFILAFERTMGPTVRSALASVNAYAQNLTGVVKSYFGTAAEQTDGEIARTEARIKGLTERLAKLEAPKDYLSNLFGWTESAKAKLNQELAEQEAKLADLKTRQAQTITEAPEVVSKEPEADEGAAARRLAVASKFEISLQELKLQRIASEEQVASSIEQVNAQLEEKTVAMRAMKDARLSELDAQRKLQEIATDEELALKKAEVSAKVEADITRIQLEADNNRIDALRRLAAMNRDTASGFTAAWKAAGAQAQSDLKNFAKMGQNAFASVQANAMSAFKALGDGSKDAASALKGFMFGAIADIAEAQGAQLLTSGLATLNPLAIAGGGALIALGSLLRSQAGGKSAGLGAQTTASSVYGVETVPTGGGEVAPVPKIPEKQGKQVTVNIMGHYFETPETRRMLTDMIRQESDATQFTIQQVGQGA